jgi:hypothetical protein
MPFAGLQLIESALEALCEERIERVDVSSETGLVEMPAALQKASLLILAQTLGRWASQRALGAAW